jgi:DNA-binding XRE family transcriptional regulator
MSTKSRQVCNDFSYKVLILLMSAGVKLRAIREAHHMGRAEFAKTLKITVKSLEKMEMERQRVTEEVFLGIGENFPDFAYWFLTSDTDAKCGHISPEIHQLQVAKKQLEE